MIDIKNINIKFKESLIENGHLRIPKGKITVLSGHSGCGKSSLLYVAGLLSYRKNEVYEFNGEKLSFNNDEIAKYKKYCIGYVFQEKTLIEHLNVYENLKFYSRLVGREIDENEAKALLSKFYLNVDLKRILNTLSGGEKQRLAICCAMIKQPQLLILDEPTSALDKKNTETIMQIVKELANDGMMILIASHDQFVKDQADVVYHIENKQLILMNEVTNDQEITKQIAKKKLGLNFYINYFLTYTKAHWKMALFLISFVTLAISIMASFDLISINFEAKQHQALNQIGNVDVLVTSNEQSQYEFTDLPISEEVYDTLIDSEYVSQLFPYYESVGLKINGEEIYFMVLPYMDYMSLDKRTENEVEIKKGIYITQNLAKQINISSGEDVTVTMLLPNQEEYEVSLPFSSRLQPQHKNKYSESDYIVYVPYDKLPVLENNQAYICLANNIEEVGLLISEIMQIEQQVGIKYSIEDRQTLSIAQQQLNEFIPMIQKVLIIVMMSLLILVYSRYVHIRRKEIVILSCNGLSNIELIKQLTLELCVQVTIIIFLSSICSSLFFTIMNQMLNLEADLNLMYLFKTIIIRTLIFIGLPTLVSLCVYLFEQPSKALRNE